MLTFDILAQVLWTSFATSTYLVLFAVAFALVLKVNRIFNFAQAAVMTVAFYAAHATVSMAGLPGWLGCLLALVAAVTASALLELVGFRSLRRRRATPMFVFIFTLIVSEMVAYLAMLIFGTWPTTIFPSLFWPVTLVGNVAVSDWDLPAIASMVGALALLFGFLRYAQTGRFMIAVADNPDLAELYGIEKDRVYLATIVTAGLLVGIGMCLYGSRAQVQPTTSIELMLFAVAATIIGGIGNLWGAALTAVALGVVQNASVLFIPAEWQGFLLYVFLFLAIVFLPNGIRLPDRRRGLARRIARVDLGETKPAETAAASGRGKA
ncbi:branched-chain amino acid ABC transporter permease [Methylobacterium nodulans]|uniref:Inner-membrane translocator n=1 Tax=Methylobacterium nodulans (strain LMG 21967 / CNCM I-2342 / ORS 2060) TaxID=460265 RepID=B8IWR4_METNO|nr:branched-chain amino acid ABC transporter permease [Methylobacterium nodulans]ACL62955.1 inner-membrane translocator [Methylobacterium nodulans ORS 2060]